MRVILELVSVLDVYLPDDAPLERASFDVEAGTAPWAFIERLGIPEHRVHLIEVNGRLLKRSEWKSVLLSEGDLVTFWPLLAGG